MTRVEICVRCAQERKRRFYDGNDHQSAVSDDALADIIRRYRGKGCPFYAKVRVKVKCHYALELLMAEA